MQEEVESRLSEVSFICIDFFDLNCPRVYWFSFAVFA